MAFLVLHLDADGVARHHEARARLALGDGFDHADFGDAAVAEPALGHRLARIAIGTLVRDRARADDRACGQRARLRGMRNEIGEAEGGIDAGIGAAERLAVVIDHQRQMDDAARPRIAQFVGRHRDRAERAGGLGLEEAEALGQFARDQAAQADVVDQHHQLDVIGRIVLRHAHGHVVGDDRDLAFHVAAPLGVAQRDVVARGKEAVAAALVHQRVVVEALGHFGAARLADQFDMVDVGRAVGPLIGAGQRRMRLALVEAFARHGFVLHIGIERFEPRGDLRPIVECMLQRRGDVVRRAVAREVLGHDHELAVAGAVLERGEFHSSCFLSGLSGWLSGCARWKGGSARQACSIRVVWGLSEKSKPKRRAL